MLNAEAHSSSLLENRLLPFWTRRVTRIVGQVGAVVLVVGAASVTKTDGVLFVLVGAALVVVYLVTRFKDAGARREGRRAARQLAANLAAGQRPMAVAPAGLSEGGVPLEPGETCVVAGAPVEIVQWYGDPVVLTRPMFFVWGSPLAWSVTAMSFMLHARGNRKRAKKAAPRWRDPERARLWLTDRRFLLLSGRGGRSWVQVRWPSIRQARLDRDGLVLLLDEHSERPMKIRTSAAAWLHVASSSFAHQGIVRDL